LSGRCSMRQCFFSIYKLIEFADILKIKKDYFIFVKWP
jgi:hypothetical protein